MTRDEIRAVYDRGPDAVIELVERLFAIIAKQQAEIDRLTQRVKELEARLNTDSHNSSKPPSTDPQHKKKTRSLRRKSNKKSGAQPQHAPHFLQQVDNPDRLILHQVRQCDCCHASLFDVPVSDYHCRQVFDLPEVRLEVTQHQVEVKQCPQCAARCAAPFPEQVANLTQYGARIKALAVYLLSYQLLPYRRTREILQDLLEQPLAEGTLHAALQQCYDGLGQTEELIRQGILQAQIAHFDETGCYVDGKRQWLHVASTAKLTYYAHHHKRGRGAAEAIAILPRFTGRAIHDCLKSYLSYACQHGLCNAHLLRELTFLAEACHDKWAAQMKQLLLAMKQSVEEAIKACKTRLRPAEIEAFERQYDKILKRGYRAESRKPQLARARRGPQKQSKAKNLLDRLSRYRNETLAFMHELGVPFDNNLAERDLRMMKVKQKISGCFRSGEGAKIFCRIRGYISTMRKQGHNVLTSLKSVFAGRPIEPALLG